MPVEAPPTPTSVPASPAPDMAQTASKAAAVQVHVGEELVQSGATAPPRPGSARDRMFKDLRKKAGITDDPPADQPKPVESAPATPEPGEEPTSPPGSPEKPAETQAAPMSPEERKKVSPWKLVDQYKAKLATLEKEVAEFKTNGVPTEKLTEFNERIQKAESRAKELEDEMRYVNYSKSAEFQDKYQKPYEQAWHRAMGELKELTIEDPSTQQRRPMVVDDLLQLVNMPLGQAHELAKGLFGEFAPEVMSHRKEIRRLYEEQASALTEAKTKGAEREKLRAEKFQTMQTTVAKNVAETWAKANEQVAGDEKYGRYFKPVEGDEQGNQRLAKGYELVDRAFGENPNDLRLTPEQRASIVKRHAAVRNRAAAFGRLVHQNSILEAKIAELVKNLEQYQASEPGATAGQKPPANGGQPSTAREAVFGALRKMAH